MSDKYIVFIVYQGMRVAILTAPEIGTPFELPEASAVHRPPSHNEETRTGHFLLLDQTRLRLRVKHMS